MKIDRVEVYRVRNPKRNITYYFRTLKGALTKIAWWMIFNKYDEFQTINTKTPTGYDCDCSRHDNEYGAEWENCSLHDRYSGYYRILHTRLLSYLMRRYESDKMPLNFREQTK